MRKCLSTCHASFCSSDNSCTGHGVACWTILCMNCIWNQTFTCFNSHITHLLNWSLIQYLRLNIIKIIFIWTWWRILLLKFSDILTWPLITIHSKSPTTSSKNKISIVHQYDKRETLMQLHSTSNHCVSTSISSSIIYDTSYLSFTPTLLLNNKALLNTLWCHFDL